ncbi:hypothetical protein BH24CHL9_BH24CHL9_16260 [soil metagenome]
MAAGHEQVQAALAQANVVLVPVVVIGELEAAFALGRRALANRALLAEFLDEPFVRALDVTHEVARRYGELMVALRRAGTPIPVNDIWIAATALDAGGHVLTFDRDFESVPDLRVTLLA